MDEFDFDVPDVDVPEIEPDQLRDRIEAGEDVALIDARMESDFEEWRIDGETVDAYNVPYFEFLDEYDPGDLLGDLPEDERITVVCAKGGASEFVAANLAEDGYDVEHLEDGMQGWARIYEAREVTGYDGEGIVLQYQRPSSGCLSYLVVGDGEAAVVDPLRAFADRYREDAAEYDADLTYAFDTHVHADHVSGVRTLDDADAVGVVPEPAVEHRPVTYGERVETAPHGETYAVGGVELEVVHTPGHTSGMTSYLVDDALLLTGDGLFVESVARPDLESGDEGAPDAARQLHETLQERVLALDDDVVVGGAHFGDAADPAADGTYTARLGDLKAEMDALTMDEAEFVDLVLADMPPRPANYEEIIATNLGRESVGDEEAFELELGPNNCAASQGSLTGD
ncbi:MAG: MBL fold metallo-hydrolase [Halosimplex sp.]